MAAELVVPGVYRVNLGMVNVFLLVDGDALTLIDTGVPGSAPKILEAVRSLGKQAKDINHILLTHLHADHVGSANELREASGADISMHPLDAALTEQGIIMRQERTPAPGLVNSIILGFMKRQVPGMHARPTHIDCMLEDGQELPIAGGLKVVHTPGHTAGHVSFLWQQQGGVLFVGDAAGKMFSLDYPIFFENLDAGMQTLRKLGGMQFENAAFCHGGPIKGDASEQFRKKFAK